MREKFWRNRYHNYMMTYYHYGLKHITLPNGDVVREGFLYQKPNPDYDRWLPENCKPIYFKDWLKDKIPPGINKPKPGPKAITGNIYPRPVVCIETGQFFIGVREAQKATGASHVKDVCRRGHIFDHELRFTFIDPFMEDEEVDDPFIEVDNSWRGHIKYHNYNYKSSKNRCEPILDKETGIIYKSVKEACEQLNTYSRRIRENTLPGHNFIYWKEK